MAMENSLHYSPGVDRMKLDEIGLWVHVVSRVSKLHLFWIRRFETPGFSNLAFSWLLWAWSLWQLCFSLPKCFLWSNNYQENSYPDILNVQIVTGFPSQSRRFRVQGMFPGVCWNLKLLHFHVIFGSTQFSLKLWCWALMLSDKTRRQLIFDDNICWGKHTSIMLMDVLDDVCLTIIFLKHDAC